MKLTRVTESGGQYQNPAVIVSDKPGLSRRGFITATGMGVGLAAVGPVSYTHLTLPTICSV